MLEETVAETFSKITSDKYKSHVAKLFDIRSQILKNPPSKPAAAEPKVRVSQSDGQDGARFKLLWEENINPSN